MPEICFKSNLALFTFVCDLPEAVSALLKSEHFFLIHATFLSKKPQLF